LFTKTNGCQLPSRKLCKTTVCLLIDPVGVFWGRCVGVTHAVSVTYQVMTEPEWMTHDTYRPPHTATLCQQTVVKPQAQTAVFSLCE